MALVCPGRAGAGVAAGAVRQLGRGAAPVDAIGARLGPPVVRHSRPVEGEGLAAVPAGFPQVEGARFVAYLTICRKNLIIAMRTLGIGPGDEVITQANTFYSTVAAICHVGATPILVDADEQGFQMDPTWLERAWSPRTRAIIPVHLYGSAAPMVPIMAFLTWSTLLQVVHDLISLQVQR